MVLLEAMACGLPVVATDVGGTREVIQNGVNGFLVPPRNGKAVAQTLSKLLSLKNDNQIFREESRKTIEASFDWDKNVQNLVKTYEEFL